MRQIIKQEELVGKVVKSVHFPYDTFGCMVFADDTFVLFNSGNDYVDIDIWGHPFDVDPTVDNYERLYSLGLIPKQKRDILEVEKNLTRRQREEQAEIAKLKELQRKYPDVK